MKDIKKIKKKKYTNLLLLIAFALFISANYTFSLFSSTADTLTTIDVAKFYVEVNSKNLGEKNKFDLNLSDVANTTSGKISPDSEGYFDVEIVATRYRS